MKFDYQYLHFYESDILERYTISKKKIFILLILYYKIYIQNIIQYSLFIIF